VDLDAVADELYGLAPEEFTATRTAREKDAKAAGAKSLANEIHQLQKPDAAAWLANQLARDHPEQIGPLLDLGAGLRQATASLSGDLLREMGRQQRQLIDALVQQARRGAREQGRKVTEATARELENTLRAALSDEAAGAQLAAGRLTKGLQSIGFTPSAATAAAGTATAPPAARPISSAPSAAARRKAAELEEATRAVELAGVDLAEAAETLDEAQQTKQDADQAVDGAAAEVTRVRQQLAAAEAALNDARQAQRGASSELAKAERAAGSARRRLEEAAKRREQAK
jgi:hypothetical protein